MIGTRLGPYEITAKLGEGGMGEVWRAHDSKLKRDVAIKVLPPGLTEDRERLQRFEREAQLLAQLQHPNIASIYAMEKWGQLPVSSSEGAVEQSGGGKPETVPILALVMELVEGPTLAERLEAGPFSFDECLSVSVQIASALEEAHEKGIVHRDLKPQNIKASIEGKTKVLDFGLAKAMDSGTGFGAPSDLAHSPTVTFGATREGVILGTAAYMAPEQARGAVVDKRADIWAFGVVLYEMLSGERLFAEGSVVDTLSAVMRKEIDLDRLPAATPPRLRELVARCLERDPKRRLRDIGDARWLLAEGLAAAPAPGPAAAPAAPSIPVSSTTWGGLSAGRWAALAAAALLFAAVAGWRSLSVAPSPPPVSRSLRATIPLPDGLELDGVGAPEIALSPDGSTLAFLARGASGPQRLYVRRLDGDETKLVPSSETAEGPFFSPDGKWVAFAVGVSMIGGGLPPELRKYSLDTGLTQTIAPVDDYFGGVWREDGTIFFVNKHGGALWSVPASGGAAAVAVGQVVDRGERRDLFGLWPALLPGGRSLVLATAEPPLGELFVLDLDSAVVTRLGLRGMSPRYLPTGHLAYGGESGALEVVRFDAGARRLLGAPVAIVAGVARARNASATFAVADDGTLVYAAGYLRNSRHEPMRVVRASRSGELETLPIEPDLYGRAFAVAPDGRRLALAREDAGAWVADLERGTRTKIGGGLTGVSDVVWSPAADQLAWVATSPGSSFGYAILVQPSDGRSAPHELRARATDLFLAGWTPSGREVVFIPPGTPSTFVRLPLDGEGTVVWSSPGPIGRGALSPDGRSVAYESDEDGEYEIYLVAFASGERTQVTATGGRRPAWSRDGRELFYRRDGKIHAVEISAGADGRPRIGRDSALFDWPAVYSWAAGADGDFYGTEPVPGAAVQTSLQLRTGWFAEVERLAWSGGKR